MASTANELINRAARRLGILAESETLSANAAVDALSQLNEMLHGFGTRGIHYAHTTLSTGSTTVNVPDEQTRNVMLMLAKEMADEYGIDIGPQLAVDINEAKQALQAYYTPARRAVGDRALQRRTSGWGGFNIRTGDE